MRAHRLATLILIVAVCVTAFMSPTPAGAVPTSVSVSIDENGHSTAFVQGGAIFTLVTGTTGRRKINGIANVLFYKLPAPHFGFPSFVSGYLSLLEPDGSTSDVVRFAGRTIYFFSDNEDSGGDLADTGLPKIPRKANQTTRLEIGPESLNFAFYVPEKLGKPEPGFSSNKKSAYDYIIISDIPEPGTLILLGGSLIALGAVRGTSIFSRLRRR